MPKSSWFPDAFRTSEKGLPGSGSNHRDRRLPAGFSRLWCSHRTGGCIQPPWTPPEAGKAGQGPPNHNPLKHELFGMSLQISWGARPPWELSWRFLWAICQDLFVWPALFVWLSDCLVNPICFHISWSFFSQHSGSEGHFFDEIEIWRLTFSIKRVHGRFEGPWEGIKVIKIWPRTPLGSMLGSTWGWKLKVCRLLVCFRNY